MLSTLHNRAYQDFLTLLTEFHNLVINSALLTTKSTINQEFLALRQWFELNIVDLDGNQIEPSYFPRWQSIQREIQREFKLLTTDILFLASARQDTTKNKRLESIENRLDKLISYCQLLIQEEG